MKNLILAILFLLINAAPGWATIALVNNDANHGHVTCTAAGDSCMTANMDTSGATLIIADLLSVSSTMGITDLVGAGNTNNGTSFNTWTCLSKYNTGDGVYKQICYAIAPTTGPDHVFWLQSGAGGEILNVTAWSGANVVPAVYATGTNNGNGSSTTVTSITTGTTGTLPEVGDLVFSGWGTDWTNITGLAATGLTIIDTTATSANSSADAYVVAGSTTAVNSTWSHTGTNNELMVATIAAFRPIVGTPIYVYNFTSGGTESPDLSLGIVSNPITIPTGAGVVCGVVNDGSSLLPTSVTDANNTYTDTGTHLTATTGSGTVELSVWYKANATGGSLTPTANYGTSTYGFIMCHDYMNMATSSMLDTVTSGTSASSPISVNFSTTFANDAIFVLVGAGTSGSTTYTAGTNFTLRALDYCALQCGPGAPSTPYTDIWQYHAIQDWYPNATKSSQAAAMTYNETGGAGMIIATFKGLGASSAHTAIPVIF